MMSLFEHLNVKRIMYLNMVGFFAVLVLVQYVIGAKSAKNNNNPVVTTSVGLIVGRRALGSYDMFLGIPYALVDKRKPFGPAKEHPIFTTPFEAYDDSAICPQLDEFSNTIVGSLNCLHLNIYVPRSEANQSLPVLVWFHGSGFAKGYSGRYLYGPKYIVKHGIILVTFNYRLGPYGFMCLNIPEVPGNQGLKDQLMALKWIKNNIKAFGGDSKNITLFGTSTGAMSIDLHLYSKHTNLFNRVIIQSGTALLPGLIKKPDPEGPFKLIEAVGFNTTNIQEALDYLADLDSSIVIKATSRLNYHFLPCVEEFFEGVRNFISDYTVNQKVPKMKNMEIIIGHTSNEMIAVYNNLDPKVFEKSNVFINLLKIAFNFTSTKMRETVELVRHFYLGDQKIDKIIKPLISNFAGDMLYNYPVMRSIGRYLDSGAAKVFYYVFSYNGERNFVKKRKRVTADGAAHGDEIGYLFDISFFKDEPTPEDDFVIDEITTMWTNFAKYGHPTPMHSDLFITRWLPVTNKSVLPCMEIGADLHAASRPFHSRMAFWELFYRHHWQKQIGYRNVDPRP